MTQLTQHSIDSGMERPTYMDTSSSAATGWGANLSYLLIGGGIGATLALLFAPKAGSELRSDISTAAQKGYGSALDLSNKVIDQSRDMYGNLKQKADDMTGGAASRLEGQVMNTVSNIADKTGIKSSDLPNGGGEVLEGLSDAGGRDKGSAKGTNTGF
jgi:gas vesicle protein